MQILELCGTPSSRSFNRLSAIPWTWTASPSAAGHKYLRKLHHFPNPSNAFRATHRYLGNFYAEPQWLHVKILELLSYELTEKGALLRTLNPGSDEVLTHFLRLWKEAQQIQKSFTNFFHFLV